MRTVLCLCLLQVRTLLQYIANQLKNDNAYDLLVLSEIISKMVRRRPLVDTVEAVHS